MKRHNLRFGRILISISGCAVAANLCAAEIVSFAGIGTRLTENNYTFSRGTGNLCEYVNAQEEDITPTKNLDVRPAGTAINECNVQVTGVNWPGWTKPGVGTTLNKPGAAGQTASASIYDKTRIVKGDQASAWATWTYARNPAPFSDVATYVARTQLSTIKLPGQPFTPSLAGAKAGDPIVVLAGDAQAITLDLGISLTPAVTALAPTPDPLPPATRSLELRSEDPNGVASIGFVYEFDDAPIFRLTLEAFGIIDSKEDVFIRAETFGTSADSDSQIEAMVRSALQDDISGLVYIDGELPLYQALGVSMQKGEHRLEGTLTVASTTVDEPSTVTLAVTTLAMLIGARFRNRFRGAVRA